MAHWSIASWPSTLRRAAAAPAHNDGLSSTALPRRPKAPWFWAGRGKPKDVNPAPVLALP